MAWTGSSSDDLVFDTSVVGVGIVAGLVLAAKAQFAMKISSKVALRRVARAGRKVAMGT